MPDLKEGLKQVAYVVVALFVYAAIQKAIAKAQAPAAQS